MRRLLVALAIVVPLLGWTTADATNSTPGPRLDVPVKLLAAALSCPSSFTHHQRDPVLLVHGTNVTADENWGWNYAAVLPALGFDTCTVQFPSHARADIQKASEYVVYAVRVISARAHRDVDIIGHSQGTLQPRWAMRWWPDIPAKVNDYVSLAGPNHGISSADGLCIGGSCFPAAWQMRSRSNFLAALNRGPETPPGVSVTSIYSRTDELVQPYSTAPLRGGSNIAVQDVCPGRAVDHVSMADDAVVFTLVLDALTHAGPTNPARAAPDCSSTFMPGITAADVSGGQARLYGDSSVTVMTATDAVTREPPLASYVR
jgi:triacylglycerol lipase